MSRVHWQTQARLKAEAPVPLAWVFKPALAELLLDSRNVPPALQ